MSIYDRDWYRDAYNEKKRASGNRPVNGNYGGNRNRGINNNNLIYYLLGIMVALYCFQNFTGIRNMPVTLILLATNLIVFLLVRQGKLLAVNLGTSYVSVVRSKQYKRLLSAMFTHEEGWHIFCNAVSIFNLMPFLEEQLGSVRALILYLATGLIGGFLACLLHKNKPYTVSIGASGAICGVYGFVVIWLIRYGWWRSNLEFIFLNLIILLAMTRSPRIDSKAHFCCMAVGAAAGIVCWAITFL